METSFKNMFCISGLQKCCQFWKRRAPRNDEDPSNKISKMMDMRPTSIKTHEWIFVNIVHQKKLAGHKVFLEKMKLWILGNLGNLQIWKIMLRSPKYENMSKSK